MMVSKKRVVQIGMIFLLACLSGMQSVYAQPKELSIDPDGLGQSIEITTRLRSFVGKPIWTFIVRDIDAGRTFSYITDLRRGDNHWVFFTHSRNYLITASRLQIVTYQSRCNHFRNFRINNFCNLESNGRIIRGRSLFITIEGDLSPNTCTYICHMTSYPTNNFFVYKPPACC